MANVGCSDSCKHKPNHLHASHDFAIQLHRDMYMWVATHPSRLDRTGSLKALLGSGCLSMIICLTSLGYPNVTMAAFLSKCIEPMDTKPKAGAREG